MPSAGSLLSGALLNRLQARGIALGRLTHAAGLSSSGEAALDARLPLPERSRIPARLAEQVERTRERGGRVVAVGTSVVRALEDNARANRGRLAAGERIATLRLDGAYQPQVVSGVLSGVHVPGGSHYDLLAAFAPQALLAEAGRRADREGFLAHEFGEHSLLLPWCLPARASVKRLVHPRTSRPRLPPIVANQACPRYRVDVGLAERWQGGLAIGLPRRGVRAEGERCGVFSARAGITARAAAGEAAQHPNGANE